MPEKSYRKVRNIIIRFHKGNSIVKVYHSLRNTTQAFSFTLIHCCSIISKNVIPVLCKIIRYIHIGILASAAESVSNDHYPVLILSVTVKIASKQLSFVRGERILFALQSVKILDTKHQGLIAVCTYIKIIIVHLYAESPPSDSHQNDDA